jgi:putative PIG3 family NAD(P)H quinone oxidoreductase
MKALLLPDLSLVDRPDPIPGPGELLVSVRAAGLNRADLAQRAGRYPAPPGWPADIPGLEYAGVVTALGTGVSRFTLGDRVMGLVGGGAMVEQLVVHEDEAIAVPERLSDAEAAAVPEAFLTAWDALVLRGAAMPGDRVLMHAVGSGVGTAAVQFAEILGITMIGTSRTAEKLERCRTLGMHHGVLTTDPAWPAAVGGPVQVIVDTLGASALSDNLGLLAPLGRLVVLGLLAGTTAPIDLGVVLRKRLTVVGTAMRSRSAAERYPLVARFTDEVLPHLASGRLRPLVDQVFPMTDAAHAYELMAGNTTFGKVVLVW